MFTLFLSSNQAWAYWIQKNTFQKNLGMPKMQIQWVSEIRTRPVFGHLDLLRLTTVQFSDKIQMLNTSLDHFVYN